MDLSQFAVTIRSLQKNFGKKEALSDLNLYFDAGRMHAIIGPEGAGKTTLLRLMVGLMTPSSGEIIYQKTKDPTPLSFEKIREQIAYMPERPSLFADLSIKEHLTFFAELYGLDHQHFVQRSQELLQMTQLTAFQDRPAGKLSGGMYKKLGLICALLRSPQILLLDEPTNGVDPIARRDFWQLLTHFISQGPLIIVTTAYMDEAERCDHVHLLQNGRLILSGPPHKLLQQKNVSSIADCFTDSP